MGKGKRPSRKDYALLRDGTAGDAIFDLEAQQQSSSNVWRLFGLAKEEKLVLTHTSARTHAPSLVTI